ncbi:SDR family oxidoreductase [Thalassobaculum sp. OXR-137]|uniref:SDR family oxidoreductase n=1 Tax=Thalassobaculum sp. OXR-137 TaxID=3100173 RepID=UPI002AC8D305|nr:SDR family oxidoreductase [Thalassobaculum sp. OXR-137]WPZ33077.1 SDR family oxidoreductase [Thalassobaculum sp. OXR-137]
MAEEKGVALIAGVSGIVGRGIATRLLGEGWRVIGLSRTPPKPGIDGLEHVAADLTDGDGLTAALAGSGAAVTHIFYAGRAPDPDPAVEAARNTAMLVNTVEAAEAAGAALAHVHSVHGTKWYGSHVGPFKTPAAEDDPRCPVPNFYFDQQDWLEAAAPRRGFTWSTTRPHLLIGFSLGYPHNILSVVAVHAVLCREQGRPLTFPGAQGHFDRVSQVTDIELLVDAMQWCATSPSAANQPFNVINADYFRWKDVWPDIAAFFGMEAGGVKTESLAASFAAAEGPWREMVTREGLSEPDIGRIASGPYGDATFSATWDDMSSTVKIRRAGFDKVYASRDSLLGALAAYRRHRVIP